jgi:hypothetical protein
MIKALINDLAYDKITLSQGLTRAKLIAFKVDNETFQSWLRKELEGYALDDILPEYRLMRCQIKVIVANQFRKQKLPVSFDNWPELKELMTVNREIRSISGLEENYLTLTSDIGYLPFEPGMIQLLEDTFKIKERYRMHVIEAGQEVNKLQLKRIIDLTKQKLIDTLLQLNKEFPNVDNDFTMSKEQTDKIQNIITNNIYGSNNPVNVAAGQDIDQNDFTFNIKSDFSELEKLGVEKKDITELENIVDTNQKAPSELKAKAMKWLGSITSSIAARGLYDNIPALTEFIHHNILK